VAHFPPPLGRKTFEKANIEFFILMLTRKTQSFQRESELQKMEKWKYFSFTPVKTLIK